MVLVALIAKSAFVLDGDGEPESQRMQQGIEAPKFRIAPLGKHSVQAFPIELGLFRKSRDPALRLGDVPYGEKKRLLIAIL